MSLNREKATFAIAVLVFLAGAYGVVVSFVSPAHQVRIPNIELPRGERELFAPQFRRFAAAEVSERNPFSFSEGWQPLDTISLPKPPLPIRVRVLPGLSASVAAEDGGLLFESKPPVESDGGPPETKAGDSAGTGIGTGSGTGSGTGDAGGGS